MQTLESYIREKGKVYPGNILKVDSFLNHQIEPSVIRAMAKEIRRLFADCPVTKVLTIEASGIAIAILVAEEFGVPMLFAKKSHSANLSPDVYSTKVTSYTHGTVYDVRVAKDFLRADDHVLLVDDFLANGAALLGLADLVRQAGATLSGAAIAIEKGFQQGGQIVREAGIRLESLAIVDSMQDGNITFREQPHQS